MVIRELKDGRSYVSLQEDHAELAAQFAAHWGNSRFSKLRPYDTMVFATTYHDSGYREFEGNPPKNVEWLNGQNPYAGLLVSMHRTGLWHNRYNIFTEPAGRVRERSGPVKDAKVKMESQQAEIKRKLMELEPGFENELAYNYMALQVFDLLSLYFCCDGYASENQFKEYAIAPVRVSYENDETVRLTIKPNGAGAVVIDPYPFDVKSLQFSA